MSDTTRPFAALLAAATRDADAAEALARAYERLPADTRARLLAAVFEDAAVEQLSLPAVLLPLLAVERDPEIARRLAHALRESSSGPRGEAVRPAAGHRAVAGFAREGDTGPGDAGAGTVGSGTGARRAAGPPGGTDPLLRALFLVRPLHGRFVETAAVGWDAEGRVDRARVDAIRRADEADTALRSLPDGLRYEPMPFQEGVALLVRTLWDHRTRHGALPASAAPLASFLRD